MGHQREQLMNNATNDLISFQPQETSYTAAMSNEQVLQYQDRMIADQDRGLENLSAIIGNQKRIASTIGNEVDRQNGKRTEIANSNQIQGCFFNLSVHLNSADWFHGRSNGEFKWETYQPNTKDSFHWSEINNMW